MIKFNPTFRSVNDIQKKETFTSLFESVLSKYNNNLILKWQYQTINQRILPLDYNNKV